MSEYGCPPMGRSKVAAVKFDSAPFSKYVVEPPPLPAYSNPMPADPNQHYAWADNFGPFSRDQLFRAGLRTKSVGDLHQAVTLSEGFGEIGQWSHRTWQKNGFPRAVAEDVDQKMSFTEVQKREAYIRPAKGCYFPCWDPKFGQNETIVYKRPKAKKTYHPSKCLLRDDPYWDAPKINPPPPKMVETHTGKYTTFMKTTNGFPNFKTLAYKVDPKW